MGRIEYRKGLAHIIAETYAFRCRSIRPIFNSEVKSDKLLGSLFRNDNGVPLGVQPRHGERSDVEHRLR